jgi:gluconolactonase
MKKIRLIVMCFVFAGLGLGQLYAQAPGKAPAQAAAPKPAGLMKVDPAMDDVIAPDTPVQTVVGDYFYFVEGPLWVPQGKDNGYMLFAEMAENKILKLTMDGKVSMYMDYCGYHGFDAWRHGFNQTNGKPPTDPDYKRFNLPGCNGLARDNEGRLISVTWGGRSLDRIEKNGKRTVLTDNLDGKKFNGTNDVVVKKDDAIYFTDGPGCGGLRLACKDPEMGLDYPGVFMWKNGKTSLIDKVPGANGLALSPDEKYLYTNGGRLIKKYKLLPDDSSNADNVELLVDLSKNTLPGGADGMKVDSKGNIYTSCCGGIAVISPEGKYLGSILVPETVANLNFGDPDYKSLYIFARTSIYKVRVKIPGIPGR